MGVLSVAAAKGKENFSFAYDTGWLKTDFLFDLDPDWQLYRGSFFPRNDKPNFGTFLDSCPDRWGRVLMQRREAETAKQEGRAPKKLLESDYLLGVFDGHRMGGLRFKETTEGPFLNYNHAMATPPWTSLRQLEEASLHVEKEETGHPDYLRWLHLLLAPGSSLGGARPKASVIDTQHQLWVAKFPSKNDEKDMAAWEMITYHLANLAGLQVTETKLLQLNGPYHTFLSKRFDRTMQGARIHFASAMTMLGRTDGIGSEGASYLELMEFISKHAVNVEQDLAELWRRIVFSISVKNTDDHLRNHGFLLTKKGWQLSPVYDLNPNEFGKGLSINISETDNSLDLDLARSVAPYFRLSLVQANNIIQSVEAAVKQWRKVAVQFNVSRAEQERMAVAFEKNHS
jgi:serine/threonine-protein kinase HipA